MRRILKQVLILCSCGISVWAQPVYFQQRVDYSITAKLQDETHTLSAFEQINYVNNAPQVLDVIYFHLWPNAYKNNNTALAKQLLWQGKTDFYYAKSAERGFIDSLQFKVNGIPVKWELDKEHPDICKLILNQPLQSKDSIRITTPFYLKIPDAKFSRLGHTGQAYYMTQWYPKPAVYDAQGWHTMPYLDQGEFFSEFGSFDVSITLPDNYVICATGDKEFNPDEEDFMKKRMKETERELERRKTKNDWSEGEAFIPASSKLYKTVRFKQTQVHDFAWFADKRFYVQSSEVSLEKSKRTVKTWVYFTPKNIHLWKDAVQYVNSAVTFYSQQVGEYPYNQVSAVDGSIMAGGGMEYPTITVIGEASSAMELDMVITHEVGHNWFYGILASNERDHPFLDEGMNSFFELRYLRSKYPDKKISEFLGKDSTFKLGGTHKIPFWKYHEIPYYSAARANSDQAIFLASDEFTESNYGSSVYSKSALVMDYLMDYVGENVMNQAMQAYYETYKFKHPAPEDLFRILNQYTKKDLSTFQKQLFQQTDKIDYKIKKIKALKTGGYAVTVKNKTGTVLPFTIYAYDKNKNVTASVWLDGFEKKRTFELPVFEVDRFKIDGLDRMPDMQRKNNQMRVHGMFKQKRPLQLAFIAGFEEAEKAKLYYVPLAAGNFYNGAMLGMAFHNYGFYQKRFEYLIAPMFAFATKSPVGFAEFNANVYPKKHIKQIIIGTKAKTFAYDGYNTDYVNQVYGRNYANFSLNYYKISPYIRLELRNKKPTAPVSQFITYTNNNLFTDSLDTGSFQNLAVSGPKKRNTYSFVNQLSYEYTNTRALDPYRLHLQLQHTGSMAKIATTFHYKINVRKNRDFDLRFFAGTFLAGSEQEKGYYAFRASGYNGWHDNLFEGNYAARNERIGFGFSQFMERDGALKIWTPLGQTTWWMTSLNAKSPKIFGLPLKLFADVMVCDARSLNDNLFLWDAGVNLSLWSDIIDVYLPLFYSPDIKETLDLNGVDFLNTIRFTFNIHKLAPKSILQNSFF